MKSTCILLAAFGFAVASQAARAADADCQARSADLLDHLDRGDFAGASAHFDDKMKAAVSTDKLAGLWSSLGTHFGARGPREQPQVSQTQGYAVVVTPMHYGTQLVDAQVACNADGSIAGFYVKPHGVPPAG